MQTHNTPWLLWVVIGLLATQLLLNQRAAVHTRTLSHQLTRQIDSLYLISDQLIRLQQDYERVSHHLQTTRVQAASVQASLHQLAREHMSSVALLQQELQRLLASTDTLEVAPVYSSTDSLLFQP